MRTNNRAEMYYTYAYLREDKTPYYIGKGSGKRVYSKIRSVSIPPKNRILILKKDLTEDRAFQHEKYMIAVFGRKDLGTGILHNKTDGGEGVSGHIYTEEQKQKITQSKLGKNFGMVGENHHMYGKTHTPEARKKMSEKVSGEKHPMYGKKGKEHHSYGYRHTEESRKQMSEISRIRNANRRWWNNGLQNKFVVECPGTEWRCGRLKTNQSKGH
jgi:hypothetical protein